MRHPDVRHDVRRRSAPARGERKRAPGATQRAAAKRLRVLVVDDDAATAQALAALLRLWGCDAEIAHDGETALATAPVLQPEVVLLDLALPGIDGYEVAVALRRRAEFAHRLIIAITGRDDDQARRRSRAAGFDHHLVKPVDVDLLHKLLGS